MGFDSRETLQKIFDTLDEMKILGEKPYAFFLIRIAGLFWRNATDNTYFQRYIKHLHEALTFAISERMKVDLCIIIAQCQKLIGHLKEVPEILLPFVDQHYGRLPQIVAVLQGTVTYDELLKLYERVSPLIQSGNHV